MYCPCVILVLLAMNKSFSALPYVPLGATVSVYDMVLEPDVTCHPLAGATVIVTAVGDEQANCTPDVSVPYIVPPAVGSILASGEIAAGGNDNDSVIPLFPRSGTICHSDRKTFISCCR